VVHRDLASRNVLVFRFSPSDREQVLVKVTDYGLALVGAQGSRGVTTHSGEADRPVRWLSPEALQRRVYSQASDVWAYGVTLWEIWSGAMVPYWDVESDKEVSRLVARGERLARPEGCSEAVWTVLPCPAGCVNSRHSASVYETAASPAEGSTGGPSRGIPTSFWEPFVN
jgi:serine/threonine protein kinase